MEGRTLAIAAFNTKLDDDFQIMATDPAERAKIEAGMRDTEARIERDMDPFVAARQMDTDEIVELGELRALPRRARRDGVPEHRLSPRSRTRASGRCTTCACSSEARDEWTRRSRVARRRRSSARPRPAGSTPASPPVTSSRRATRSASSRCSAASSRIIAPRVARPRAIARPARARAPRRSRYGDVLFTRRRPSRDRGAAASRRRREPRRPRTASCSARRRAAGSTAARRPTSRAFVDAGDELAAGDDGVPARGDEDLPSRHLRRPDVPARAKVREVLVADGADVNAGDPLLALDPA